MRYLILLGFMLIQSVAQANNPAEITFHFYGAYDCPPCMKFKNHHLVEVQQNAQTHGFSVAANVIDYTSDVAVTGSYGNADPLLRKAGAQLRFVYPPVFFVTVGDQVVVAYLGNWRKAQQVAISYSQQAKSR